MGKKIKIRRASLDETFERLDEPLCCQESCPNNMTIINEQGEESNLFNLFERYRDKRIKLTIQILDE